MKSNNRAVMVLLCAFITGVVVEGSAAAATPATDDGYMGHMKRGATLVAQRRNEEALDAFKRAAASDPHSLDACFNVGSIARKLKRCEDAVLYFRSFLYLTPGTEDDGTAKKAISECEGAKGTGIKVKVDQPGFEVYVNGLVVGRNQSVEVELMPGRYQISVGRGSPDFEEVIKTVEVTAGSMAAVDVVLPRKVTYGFMQVVTTPAEGVDVYLEERFIGKTPVEKIRLESAKKHFLRLELAGYDRWIRNVVVTRDKTTTVTAVLEKTKGDSGAVPKTAPDQVGVNGK